MSPRRPRRESAPTPAKPAKGPRLSHVAPDGSACMVDVSSKAETLRTASAQGHIRMNLGALDAIRSHQIKKGDVLSVARIAGVMAAKRTADLVPLCHPLLLDDVQVELETDVHLPGVVATSLVRSLGRTGVEMEALVAVTVALVTVYDMVKSVDRNMTLGDISVVEKTGGRSSQHIAG